MNTAQIGELSGRVAAFQQETEGLKQRYEGKMQQLLMDMLQEREHLRAEGEKQRAMLEEELRVNEVIKGQMGDRIGKMGEEMRELKRIIKVPRMHFKYLEKMEYEEIVEQMREIDKGGKGHYGSEQVRNFNQVNNKCNISQQSESMAST